MTTEPILPRSYSAQEMKEQYARVAWFYDAWSCLTEEKAMNRLLELTEVQDGTNILEVAVGTGRLFSGLVERNPSGRNEGLDLSPDMLAHAQQRLERSNPDSKYHLFEGSAYELPFEEGAFDLLFNTFMIDMFPVEDYPRVLGEFNRVLKPGGKVAIAYFSHGLKRINHFWPWMAKHFPALLTGCRPVVLEPSLLQVGFSILQLEEISQSTFPSAVVVAQKER
jgi:ubiquinone/menaquinone biosynthesis C-methylase UbiE